MRNLLIKILIQAIRAGNWFAELVAEANEKFEAHEQGRAKNQDSR